MGIYDPIFKTIKTRLGYIFCTCTARLSDISVRSLLRRVRAASLSLSFRKGAFANARYSPANLVSSSPLKKARERERERERE